MYFPSCASLIAAPELLLVTATVANPRSPLAISVLVRKGALSAQPTPARQGGRLRNPQRTGLGPTADECPVG